METIPSDSGDPRRVFWQTFVAWQELASDADLEQLEASLLRLGTLACSDAVPVGQAIELVLRGEPDTRGIPGSLRQRLEAARWPPARSAG